MLELPNSFLHTILLQIPKEFDPDIGLNSILESHPYNKY